MRPFAADDEHTSVTVNGSRAEVAETAIVVDESELPLVVLTFPAEFTNAQWQEALDRVSAIIDRGRACAFVLDASRLAGMPNAHQRKVAGEWTTKYSGNTAVRAWALVITSPVVRGAVTAINWLSRPTRWPQKALRTVEEARSWALDLLR